MLQIDERFKDATPEATVARIENILKQHDIVVTEEFGDSGIKNCHSLQLTVKGTGNTTNGKGVTQKLARASAYAEMMERLQSDHLGHITDKYTRYSAAVRFDKEQLLSNCAFIFEAVAKSNPHDDGTCPTADELADLCIALDDGETAKVIRYVNASTGEVVYFPVMFTRVYSSTGLAAGNTTEEALVQGLSEIFERHCKLRIMREKLVPPRIPDEYLSQFPDTYETIKAIREAGYDVIVKDCSLETPFPVLAAVLVDKRTHTYHVHLGCHPIFEIALRRTLTETFQGRTLKNVASISTIISADNYKATDAEIVKNMVSSVGAYPAEFFGESSEPFKPHKNRTGMNNKAMLSEIIEYLKSRGYNVLVRDNSTLGFPTYRIIVPGFCEVFTYILKHGLIDRAFKQIYDATPGGYLTDLTKEKAALRIKLEERNFSHGTGTSFVGSFANAITIDSKTDGALYYLNMAYLEWAAQNTAKAATYLTMVQKNAPEFDKDYLHCLANWIKCRGTTDEIKRILSPFYYEEILNEVASEIASGNPFKRYAHNCAETNCGKCKFKDSCLRENRMALREKVNVIIEAFDNDSALDNLKSFFSELNI